MLLLVGLLFEVSPAVVVEDVPLYPFVYVQSSLAAERSDIIDTLCVRKHCHIWWLLVQRSTLKICCHRFVAS